jgi:microsomal epoxide hydrolase
MRIRPTLIGSVVTLLGIGAAAPDALGQPLRSMLVTAPDGAQIHVLEAGRGNAVLFVPGWTMPAEIWEPQISALQSAYHVVAMDPRAQGRSSAASEGLYPAGRARDIKAVVDALGLAPVVLVGWSMAVNELAAYVDQFGTESVAGLVLVDGSTGQDFDLQIMPRMLRNFVSWLADDRRTAVEAFVRSLYRTPQSEDYLQRIVEAALRTPANSAFTLATASVLTDSRPHLAKIDRPTLIVAAAGPFIEAFRDMQRRIANSRLVVFDNVGHALFVDAPDRFNRLLDEFLGGLWR